MMRLVQLALLTLLVTVALVSYGAKEEARAKRAALEERRDRIRALEDEIATLQAEWRHLSSPEALTALAVRLYGEPSFRAADGAPLAPWTAEQLLDLNAPVARPSLRSEIEAERPGLLTGSVEGAGGR